MVPFKKYNVLLRHLQLPPDKHFKFNTMKKSLFGFIMICVIFISCKKEHSTHTDPAQTSHKVSFNVGFSQQTVDFNTGILKVNGIKTNTTVTALADKISVLYYAVYDSVGKTVHIIKQLSTASGFGTYTDILKPGKYTVVVAGGQTFFSLGADSHYGVPTSSLSTDVMSYYAADGIGNPFNKDTYYKKMLITVTNSDSNQSFVLDRVESQLIVTIKDAIPSNVKTILITSATAQPDRVLINTGAPLLSAGRTTTYLVVTDTVKSTDVGTTNFQLKTLFLSSQPFTLNILASDSLSPGTAGANYVAAKTVTVTGAPNTQTILSGNLFGGGGGGNGLNVKIDTAWNSTTIVKTFP